MPRATMLRKLGAPDAPPATTTARPPATTLLTENTRDGQRNCLDAAGDWLALASPQIRARSEVLILSDTRPGPEGTTGHVVIRQGESVYDPVNDQTYPSFNAFNAQGNYTIAYTAGGSAMNKILSAEPGSAERQAAIDRAKIPANVQSMLLADPQAGGDAGAPITIPAGTPTTTLQGDPRGVVRVDVSKLPDPLRSQLQASNAITTNTGAGSGASMTSQNGALYVAVNADRQLVDVQGGNATVFRTGTANVLSVFANTDMADPAQVRASYATALGLTQGSQAVQPLPVPDPGNLTADQVAAYQSLGYTVAVLDPSNGLAAVRPPGVSGQDIANIGGAGGSPVYVVVGGPPLSTFGNLSPQELADMRAQVGELGTPPTYSQMAALAEDFGAAAQGGNAPQNPSAQPALAAFLAEKYAPPYNTGIGQSALDTAMLALQATTGTFSAQTSAALAAESLNPALAAGGAQAGEVAAWAMRSASTPEATQAVLDAVGPANMPAFVATLQLGDSASANGQFPDGITNRTEALTGFLAQTAALPVQAGHPNATQAAFTLAVAQGVGPLALGDREFRAALGANLGNALALGDPQAAASESARLSALFANQGVGDMLTALSPEQRSGAMVALISTPALTSSLVDSHAGNVISAMAAAQLQETSALVSAGFANGQVPLDQNGNPVIQPNTPIPFPSADVLARHPELSGLGQPLSAGTLAVAIENGQVTPAQAASYLRDLATEARAITSPDRTNPDRYSPDFFRWLGSNATAAAIDVFNGGNPMITSGLTDFGTADAAALESLANQVAASNDPVFIASAMVAGGAEHQVFNSGLSAFANSIAAMGQQVQGRRQLVIAGLSIAASMAAPVVAMSLIPEGAVTIGALTVSHVTAEAGAAAVANGLVSTVLNAAGQYDQTGTVQWGNAAASGATNALTTFFGMRLLGTAMEAGQVSLGTAVQTSGIFTAGSVMNYALGTPGMLERLAGGDADAWKGAAQTAGITFTGSMVLTGVAAAMAPADYPGDTSAAARAARAAEIQAEVDGMGLTGSPKAALDEIYGHGVSPVDVWQGSNVMMEGDEGALYQQLKNMPGVEPRTGASSHASGADQYQIRFGDSALLFGTDPKTGATWFQMENHAATPLSAGITPQTAAEIADHMWDYMIYRVRGQNLGPMGLSPHTDANPVIAQWVSQ
jgi:hypothetical protein